MRKSIITQQLRFTARNDYAFKKLFGTEETKDIMIEFISLVTSLGKDDFKDVRIENTEQLPHFYKEKTGRLDIKIRLKDGRKIDVEMQNTYFDYYPKRSIFYCSKLIHEHFSSGLQYANLKKCIAINNPDASVGVCCSHKVVAVGFNTLCYDASVGVLNPRIIKS